MQPTTSTERIFLRLEQPGYPMDIVGIFVLGPAADGTPLPFEDVRTRLEQVTHELPVLRKKLAPAPLRIGEDHWITAGDLDIDDHVRRVEIGGSGDLQSLFDLVVELTKDPLDRRRPLWDGHVVEGLADGRTALVLRSHHALVDGMGSMEIHAALFDTEPRAVDHTAALAEFDGDKEPGVLVRAAREIPERLVTEVVGARRLAGAAAGAATTAALRPVKAVARSLPLGRRLESERTTSSLPVVARRRRLSLPQLPRLPRYLPSFTDHPPRTIFNRHVCDPKKSLTAISLPLAEIREIRAATGATVNDVLLALVTGSLRRYLAGRDSLPDRPLRTTCPVNVRPGTGDTGAGNHFTTMWVDLPTHIDDPGERLRLIHENATASKAALASSRASWDVLATVGDMLLPGVVSGAMAFAQTPAFDLFPPTLNLTVSTIQGAPVPLYLAGHLVEHFYARTIIHAPVTIFFSSITYNGSVEFSITTVEEIVPDVGALSAGLREELDQLLSLVRPAAAPDSTT